MPEFWPDLFPKEIGELPPYRTSVKAPTRAGWVSFGKHGWVISRKRRSRFPQVARYKGTASTDEAAYFVCAAQ